MCATNYAPPIDESRSAKDSRVSSQREFPADTRRSLKWRASSGEIFPFSTQSRSAWSTASLVMTAAPMPARRVFLTTSIMAFRGLGLDEKNGAAELVHGDFTGGAGRLLAGGRTESRGGIFAVDA